MNWSMITLPSFPPAQAASMSLFGEPFMYHEHTLTAILHLMKEHKVDWTEWCPFDSRRVWASDNSIKIWNRIHKDDFQNNGINLIQWPLHIESKEIRWLFTIELQRYMNKNEKRTENTWLWE